jgi:hypothetical protein
MAADHEDNTVHQDEKIGEGSKAESCVSEGHNHEADKGGQHLEKPGEIILGIYAGPNQDQKVNDQPKCFHGFYIYASNIFLKQAGNLIFFSKWHANR